MLNNTPKEKQFAGIFGHLLDYCQQLNKYPQAISAGKIGLEINAKNHALNGRLQELEAEYYNYQQNDQALLTPSSKNKSATSSEVAADSLLVQETDSILELEKQALENPDDTKALLAWAQQLEKQKQPKNIDCLLELWQKIAQHTQQEDHLQHHADLTIEHLKKQLAEAKKQYDRNQPKTLKAYQKLAVKKLKFELAEYHRRVKKFPTNLTFKFELGKIQFRAKQINDAIGSLQNAREIHKDKNLVLLYLGRCYLKKKWFKEAIETLQEAREITPQKDPTLLDIEYLLMDIFLFLAKKDNDVEALKQAEEMASNILKSDINYKDIVKKMDKIRSLMAS